MRRLGIVASVLTLVLGASSAAFATHSPAAQREVIGEYNNAKYALFLPYRWNGDLVVYAHGFIERFVPVSDRSYDDLRAMRAACEASGFLTLR